MSLDRPAAIVEETAEVGGNALELRQGCSKKAETTPVRQQKPILMHRTTVSGAKWGSF
ncbi:hypothetical protein K466DRAFT_584244 [Polyporus arcularius HHB13444]|uniref:Uncharacterized protein n=1 Tax=Polyporus arcularius HHB13444 TaxID=1314778 RepID=A0A5C3PKS0_9APHY|nr:hypothetical protein K466DRAFT_584244 [Polyporus arcularius HHB13444]